MKRMRSFIRYMIFVSVTILLFAPFSSAAVWISGSDTIDQPGIYGTKGVPHPNNVPGGRQNSMSWIDADNNLWLFGGSGFDANGDEDFLNDLWKFDGSNWTWISGSNIKNQLGIYGTKGVPNPNNIPGARYYGLAETDQNGHFWLFGGVGYASSGNQGCLNDLWKLDGANWVWISGSNVINQRGIYGTQGVANPVNVPGGRVESISWMDSDNNLWLFGGTGFDINGHFGRLNDLWKFDGTNWTWVSGSNLEEQPGVYGTQGVPHPTNVPGARRNSMSWIDQDDNLWLFGGLGDDSIDNFGRLNDLWKYDGANWTWMDGSNLSNQVGVYGTKGVADPANDPGGKSSSTACTDAEGNFWLFGGGGYWNDLWKYDGSNWTWVAGSNITYQPGVYGTKGVADPTHLPGGRYQGNSWIDDEGNFWLFGGKGVDVNGNAGSLNDLWRFNRIRVCDPGQILISDLNSDCCVDSVDLSIMFSYWLADNDCLIYHGDVYSDCTINLLDFSLLSIHWLEETTIITVE